MDYLDILIKLLSLSVFYFGGHRRVVGHEFIQWSRDLVEADEGSTVELSCTSGPMNLIDVIRLTRNFDPATSGDDDDDDTVEVKVNDDDDGDGGDGDGGAEDEFDEFEDSYTMVDNTDVKAPFSRVSRYSFRFERNSTYGSVWLRINGLQPKDSGAISCFKLKTNREVARTKIIVKERSLEGRFVTLLKSSGEFAVLPRNSSELPVNTDLHDGFGCMLSSHGGHVHPSTFDLVMDGRTCRGVAHGTTVKRFPPTERDLPYVQFRSLAYVRPGDLMLVDGKSLECKAQGTKMAATIRVQHPPIVKDCSREGPSDEGHHHHHQHNHHQRYHSLSCSVLSQSPFTVKVTQGIGHREVKYSLTEQAQSKNEVRIKVTLEEEVEQQIVTFHLANSAGQKTKVFDLSRDEQPVEEEELTMQKDFKLTGSERKDLDYVQNGKTAVALGSQSASSKLCFHVPQAIIVLVMCAALL